MPNPKMEKVLVKIFAAIQGSTPVLSVSTDDNLCSSVCIRGALEPRSEWVNGIFHNASYFIFFVRPPNKDRWYDETKHQKLTISLESSGSNIGKFRKYTATPEKVAAKLKEWLEQQMS